MEHTDQHKHVKPNGMMTSEKMMAENGMHRHNGCTPAMDTPGHTHKDVATGEATGPKIPRVPDPDKQRV